jgi:hypothetical protein
MRGGGEAREEGPHFLEAAMLMVVRRNDLGKLRKGSKKKRRQNQNSGVMPSRSVGCCGSCTFRPSCVEERNASRNG